MLMGNPAALTLGAATVYAGERFDPLETAAAERYTALSGLPTMFIAELDQLEPAHPAPRLAK